MSELLVPDYTVPRSDIIAPVNTLEAFDGSPAKIKAAKEAFMLWRSVHLDQDGVLIMSESKNKAEKTVSHANQDGTRLRTTISRLKDNDGDETWLTYYIIEEDSSMAILNTPIDKMPLLGFTEDPFLKMIVASFKSHVEAKPELQKPHLV